MKSFAVLILVLINQLVGTPKSKDTTIYLIRHAEKEAVGDNPELSQKGVERSHFWKNYFLNKSIDVIYVTPTKRSQMTIDPLAASLQKEIFFYKPEQMGLKVLAEKYSGKTILVVGHSNMIPDYVNQLLGENKYPEMQEDEYDNLFTVTFSYQDIYIQKTKP